MSAWMFVLRALPVTFLVYVIEAIVALLAGLPLGLEAARLLRVGVSDALGRAATLETVVHAVPALRVASTETLLSAGLLMLCAPWLQMAWLTALAEPSGLGRALSHGARLVPRALCVSLLVLLGFALAAAPWGLSAWALSSWLEPLPNARVHDLAVACALVPILPLAFAVHSWHDLARARALEEGAFASVFRSVRPAVRPGVQGRALGWSVIGLAIALGPLWAGGALHLSLGGTAVIALVQTGAFARLILRSRWLAHALLCAEDPRTGARPTQRKA